jgi:iron complex outermembrane receptor protein
VVIIPGRYFNPAPGGAVDTLVVGGGNPQLKPEKATVWTAGLDFKPAALPGFTTKLTYYDIVFKDEIAVAAASVCECNAYVDEAILGSAILQRNPSPALVQELVSQPTYVNYFGGDPATVGAIFDSRSLNLSTVKTRGIDFRFGYRRDLNRGQFETGLDGTYILQFDDRFTSVAPVASVLNTQFNPTDLRLRGRAILTQSRMSAGLYLNFTNAYTNNGVTPNEHVASWTTADAIASYQFGAAGGPSDGVSVGLSVINLTGRNPPYVSIPIAFGINYDAANANALGRYISLHLQKRW